MSFWLLLQKIHGHLALLGVALCFHPYFALRRARRPSRWTQLSGYLGTLLVALTTGTGWWIYPAYREQVKLDLYRYTPAVGNWFEVKEHIGWYAFALSLAAAAMMHVAARPGGMHLRLPVGQVYALTGILVLLVGALGIWISTVNGFPYGLDVHGARTP